jgi:hypothetical protein
MAIPTPTAPPRPAWAAASCCGLLAVALRLVVMWAPPLDIYWRGEPWTEEWMRGNLAHEIVHGPLLPLQDHQIPFWGGMNWVGVMAAPAFALFGETLFALRLATLPFAFALAWAGFLLLERRAGRRAAWLGGLVLACMPPGWLYASVTAQGTHCELASLVVVLLWLWNEDRLRGHAHKGWSFASGLAYGGHLSFGIGPALALVPLLDWARDRRFFLRASYLPRLAGIAVGSVPFLFYQLRYGGALRVYDDDTVGGLALPAEGLSPWTKLVDLASRDWADSLWLASQPRDGERLVASIAALALALGWAWAAWRWRRELLGWIGALLPWRPARAELDAFAIVLAWPATYMALYLFAPFGLGLREWLIDYRYLLAPQPFVLMAAVAALAAWSEAGPRGRRFAAAGLVACACIGFAWSAAARLEWSRAEALREAPGARPAGVAKCLLWKHGTDPERLSAFLARVEERRAGAERDDLHRELARLLRMMATAQERQGRAPRGPRDDPRRALADAARIVPEPRRAWYELAPGPARRPDAPTDAR